MNQWEQASAWFRPQLTIDHVARFLGIQPASIRRYLTDPYAMFPLPAEQRSNRNLWTPASVYRYQWDTKPTLRQRIPRLCPLTGNIPAAHFADSRTAEIYGNTYVLHTWEPGDHRGPVAIAYTKDAAPITDEVAWQLLSARPYLSALVIPRHTPDGQDSTQPTLVVADRAGKDWYPWITRWADLTALLRTDLPWWSYGLTDTAAMTDWQPGDQIVNMLPRANDLTAAHVDQCRPLDGSETDTALFEVAAATNHRLADAFDLNPYGVDNFPNQPGLQHAAVAVLRTPPTEPPSLTTIGLALRHLVTDRDLALRAMHTIAAFDVLLPAISHQPLTFSVEHCSPLADEWVHRLDDVGPSRSNELGFQWLTQQSGATPHRWWHDPCNPGVWATCTVDGRLYSTLGSRMPAQGRIEELVIEDGLPFFRDSEGTVFPVPSADGTVQRTKKYDATLLAATILTLLDDAARDVHRCDLDLNSLDVEATGLHDVISNYSGPITLSRNELEELEHETAEGAARREEALALEERFGSGNGRWFARHADAGPATTS